MTNLELIAEPGTQVITMRRALVFRAMTDAALVPAIVRIRFGLSISRETAKVYRKELM